MSKHRSPLYLSIKSVAAERKMKLEHTSPKPQSRTPAERRDQRALSRGHTAREACGPFGVHHQLRRIWQTGRYDDAKRSTLTHDVVSANV